MAQTTPDSSINQCTQFSHLGVPAPAGTGDSYENDATQPQKCLNATALALVMPAPQSSFRRRPESRGEGWAVAMTLELSHQPMHPIFIPWCAGTSRHGRLVRKHVPDSDPGCALQSTSMPALHRRILPNCRPMVDGGMRKCSAGACPPAGVGVGRGRLRRANSLHQTTTPAFHTLVCRHQPASPIGTKIRGTSQTDESRSFRRDP